MSLLTNYPDEAWSKMKDEHYWYFMEPVLVKRNGKETIVDKYVRIGPEYERPHSEARETGWKKFIECVTSPFRHLFVEPTDVVIPQIVGRNPMQNRVPYWIVEHFEKYKNVPGTFSFYELDGKLYFSLAPAMGLSKEAPCSYVAYRTMAGIFGLNLPPVVTGDSNLWVFNRLGENFQYSEDFEYWRLLVRAKTECNVYLARATMEDCK